jgi:cellulose synthase (UDP-forming)
MGWRLFHNLALWNCGEFEMTVATTSRGRRQGNKGILPLPPSDEEKISYAGRSLPLLFSALAISASFVVLAQILFEVKNPAALPFILYTAIFGIYQLISLPINFTGCSFDLAAHQALIRTWRPIRYPSVDIFLPICGEPIEVLRNTWEGVRQLIRTYPGSANAYVLDDGDSDEAARVVSLLGLTYVRRPEHVYKKSGNLNYAFHRTHGDLIVIFDADFCPRSDFLAETLPYMDDPTIGIVQTPQYFRASPQQTWVERAAGPTLEIFYRAVQISRDRFGSALCVGSNAVYRRAALEPSGGFTQIPYAEDSHTGLDARRYGYQLKYLPLPLATGVCPAQLDTFMRQQYRWCCGATSLVWTKHMWRVKMPLRSRLPYIAGWLWNFTTALRTLTLPLIPIVLLLFLPNEIRLRNSVLLIPPVITGTVLYPLWHKTKYSPRIWPLAIAVGWAQVLALWDFSRGKVMSWQPSRGPADATRRFWWGVTTWNGALALTWLGLASYRTWETHSSRFAAATIFGIINAIIVGRLIFPGRSGRETAELNSLASIVWNQRLRLVILAANGMNICAAGLLIQVILVRYGGMGHVSSYLVQAIISLQLNFILSRFATQKDREVGILPALGKFNAQQIIVTGLSIVGYAALVRYGMNYILANVVVTGIFTPVSFLSSHKWSLIARRRGTGHSAFPKFSSTEADLALWRVRESMIRSSHSHSGPARTCNLIRRGRATWLTIMDLALVRRADLRVCILSW